MEYTERGKIEYRNRARQIIDFSGMQYGNITPTDVDGLIEYHNKAVIFMEFKYNEAPISKGQRVALERLCNNNQRVGIESTVFLCEHHVSDCAEDIKAADAIVREFYYKWKWYADGKSTVKQKLDKFIDYVDERRPS